MFEHPDNGSNNDTREEYSNEKVPTNNKKHNKVDLKRVQARATCQNLTGLTMENLVNKLEY